MRSDSLHRPYLQTPEVSWVRAGGSSRNLGLVPARGATGAGQGSSQKGTGRPRPWLGMVGRDTGT